MTITKRKQIIRGDTHNIANNNPLKMTDKTCVTQMKGTLMGAQNQVLEEIGLVSTYTSSFAFC